MKNCTFFVFFLFIGCTNSENKSPDVSRMEAQAARVTIIRDNYGVPHIYGKSDADAVFGLLYAQCEDDFKRVEGNYIWAIGRLAEVEGEGQLYSDLRAKLFMTENEAKAQYESSPDWLKALCNAFADGINYYLHTHPEVKPMLLTKFEPWMPMYFSEGSIGGDLESVSVKLIGEFYDKNKSIADLVPADNEQDVKAFHLPEPQGSNGFAISGKLTQSGNAMLLINPHTSFYFRPEVHVVSEDGLNAYGAVTWGQFFIYQGFNEKNGWMHTSSYADVIDHFVEKVNGSEEDYTYQYGSEQRKMETVPVTLKYKAGEELLEKTFTGYRTHHGPITHKNDTGWVATALMWEPAKALQQAFIRTKTANFAEFRQMMEFRTNSSNNTVYADADGNIAYFHGNFMPKRDARFEYGMPVDGSDPATDWQGLHEVDEIIQLFNPGNGWIQNCNSTPFTAALEYSPKQANFPPYMATEPESFRGVHAIKVLTGRSGYTLDSLIAAAYDPYLPAFEHLIPGLIKSYENSPNRSAEHKSAIEVLKKWDLRVNVNSVGMTLAHFYISHVAANGPKYPGLSLMEKVNEFGQKGDPKDQIALFEQSVNKLVADFGTWEIPWGEVNRFQRLDGAISLEFDDAQPSLPVGMASGNWGALASYGARGNSATKKIYGTYGNSFVAVVEFGDRVKAKSILAGGQSADPNSPHFYDQALMYSQGQFKDVLYYRDDVDANAKRSYKPGE